MRKTYKDAFLKKHNIKLGFMSAFVKAAAYALADQPSVNAGKGRNVPGGFIGLESLQVSLLRKLFEFQHI